MHSKPILLTDKETNVESTERLVSALTGSLLLRSGLKSRSVFKTLIGGYLLFRGTTGFCFAYDLMEKKGFVAKPRNVNIRTSITVKKSPEEMYSFWRNLENLPLFMDHLESVKELDDIHSEWHAKLPGGHGSISWRSEIVDDQVNKRIGWESMPDSTIENSGSVLFRDAGEFGTEVQITFSYRAPVGKPGELVGRLLSPLFEKMVSDDVENLKWFLESGAMAQHEKEQWVGSKN